MILMRSRGFCPFGVRLGYSKHSSTQMRPRSSNVNAIGLMTSGSAATSLTSQPAGTLKRLSDSSGVRYGCPEGLVLTKPNSRWAWAWEVNPAQTRLRATRRMVRDIPNSLFWNHWAFLNPADARFLAGGNVSALHQ